MVTASAVEQKLGSGMQANIIQQTILRVQPDKHTNTQYTSTGLTEGMDGENVRTHAH